MSNIIKGPAKYDNFMRNGYLEEQCRKFKEGETDVPYEVGQWRKIVVMKVLLKKWIKYFFATTLNFCNIAMRKGKIYRTRLWWEKIYVCNIKMSMSKISQNSGYIVSPKQTYKEKEKNLAYYTRCPDG